MDLLLIGWCILMYMVIRWFDKREKVSKAKKRKELREENRALRQRLNELESMEENK